MQKQTFRTIQVEVNQGNRATLAEARTVLDGGEGVAASGEALRHPDDRPDPELGVQLATERALMSLARKIARRTSGRIKMNDDNRRRTEAASGTCRALTQQGTRCQRPGAWEGYCPTHYYTR